MKLQSAPIRGLSSTRHSRAEAPKSPMLRRLRDAVRVDPEMTAADRRKLSRHRIWCGEARTGLVSKLRRRLMSLGAGSRVGASPKTPDGYARESSRRAKSDPRCHLYDYMGYGTSRSLSSRRFRLLGSVCTPRSTLTATEKDRPGSAGRHRRLLWSACRQLRAWVGSADPAGRGDPSMWRSPYPAGGPFGWRAMNQR